MKAVLLNSGGIDSRVAAAILCDKGWELRSLFVDWHDGVGAEPAAETARRYCASHEVVGWPTPLDWRVQIGNRLARPYVALCLIGLAATYAAHLGVETVVTGHRREGPKAEALQSAIAAALRSHVLSPPLDLHQPVFGMTARGVSITAARLGVDLADTVSCSLDPACGRCRSCLRRAEGMA